MFNIFKRLKLYVFSKEFTFKRFFNLSLLVFQERVLKNSRVVGYPYLVYIDPINICTLKCPLCPTGQNSKARSRGKMSFDNFKKIIDEIGDYLYFVGLYNWGEPFLNKDIFKMIKYSKSKKIKTEIRIS